MLTVAALLLLAAGGDLMVTSPRELVDLEEEGFGIGRMAFSAPEARDNAALAADSGYRDLVAALTADLGGLYAKDSAWGVGMRYSHRGFDLRWLTSRKARWELAAVVNRVDRKAFAPGTCGELRFIYRLAYKLRVRGGLSSSRLPATLSAVYWQPEDSQGCAEAAARLRGKLDPSRPGRFKSLEVNLQSTRWPSTVRPDLGGHAEYVLRVFHRRGARLEPAPLENTPDVDRLRRDPAARKALLDWVRGQAGRVDSGLALAPERFLATRAVSATPRGMARPQNRPWTRLFTEKELEGLSLPPKALLRRLDGLTCMGCHQSRSVAGFHVLGEERDGMRRVDALALGVSPHVEEDLPRRLRYVESLLARRPPDERRLPPERQNDRGGFGDACGLDPAFAAWTCADGLVCRAVDDRQVGQCQPKGGAIGGACAPGQVDFARDRISSARQQALGCGDPAYCEGVSVGFPGGMCASPCADPVAAAGVAPGPGPGSRETCGAIAILEPFNACLARGEAFTLCATHARPALLRSCGAGNPCRPDYLCAKTPQGEAACLPPYFVLQMRVDGHPKPQ